MTGACTAAAVGMGTHVGAGMAGGAATGAGVGMGMGMGGAALGAAAVGGAAAGAAAMASGRWRSYIVPFALGFAAGVVVARNWPKIKEVAGPAVKGALREGSALMDRSRTALWEGREKLQDLVAEIREEEAEKASSAEKV